MTSRSRQHLSVILKLNTQGQKTPKPTGGGEECLFGEFCAFLGFFVVEILGFFCVFWFLGFLFCFVCVGGFVVGWLLIFWNFFSLLKWNFIQSYSSESLSK